MSELVHSSPSVTVHVLSQPVKTQPRNPNDVEFEVKYPEGYAGQRIMPEGPVVISKEVAEKFTSMGIGKVVTAANADAEKDAESNDEELTVSPETSEENLTEQANADAEKVSDKKGKGKRK